MCHANSSGVNKGCILSKTSARPYTYHRFNRVQLPTSKLAYYASTVLGVAVLLTLFVCLGVSAAGAWEGFGKFLAGPAAAWTQAIFGAGAIAAAVGLAWWQDIQRLRTKNDDDARLIHMAADLAHRAHHVLGRIDQMRSDTRNEESPEDRAHQRQQIKNLREILESLPLVSLPNAYVMSQVLTVREQVNKGAEILGEEHKYGSKYIRGNEQYGHPWRPLWNLSLIHI